MTPTFSLRQNEGHEMTVTHEVRREPPEYTVYNILIEHSFLSVSHKAGFDTSLAMLCCEMLQF